MPSLQQKIAEIESRSSRLADDEVTLRRKQIDDFLAISAFEGLLPSKTSLKLQELFAANKLTSSEYIELCRKYSSELGV
jgi:type III secretory pathway lipoprotein EscJ